MTEVPIVTPPGMFGASGSEDLIDTAMRVIGVGFGSDGDWCSKYGCNHENDVFMMHRYCWCEQRDCLWCTIWLSNEVECSEDEARAHREKQEQLIRERYGDWAAEYPGAPNFWYKPSGFQLRWYKYIGRDMSANKAELPGDFMQRIFATHPQGMTVEQAVEKMARFEDESAKAFQAMFDDLNARFSNQ